MVVFQTNRYIFLSAWELLIWQYLKDHCIRHYKKKQQQSWGDLFEYYLSMVWSARYTLGNQIQIKQFAMSNRQLVFRRSQLDYCIFYQDICLTYFRNSTLVISSIPTSLKVWKCNSTSEFWNDPLYNRDLESHILLQQTRCRRKIVSLMDWSTYQWIFPYFVGFEGSKSTIWSGNIKCFSLKLNYL